MTTPLCILLVDDSKFFLELERQFLRNTPATILLAASAEEAAAVAQKHLPSLIYMDVDMSGMNGFDCCRALKSDLQMQAIPVVLIGAKASAADAAIARVAGADAYLTKPLDRRQFLDVGHNFLMSIERREPRRDCRLPVDFICRGLHLQGHCIDVSTGGMFLGCRSTVAKGEALTLKFSLPDEHLSPIELHGRIAWVNSRDEIIKPDYPLGYGIEFIDIPEEKGTALRRCFSNRWTA